MASDDDRIHRAFLRPFLRVLDPVLTLVLVYLALDASSLAYAGLYSPTRAVLTNLLAIAVLTGMVPLMKDRGSRILAYLSGPFACLLGSLAMIHLESQTFEESVKDDVWWGWVAPTWHHVPQNYFPLYEAVWPYALGFALVVLVALCLHAVGRRWAFALLCAVVLVGLYGFVRTTIPEDIGFAKLFLFPLPFALVFGFAGQRVVERRIAIFSLFGAPALAAYVCLIPLAPTTPAMAGLTRIYPEPGREPAVSMVHLRGAVFDKANDRLVMSWGSTCGLLEVDNRSGAETVLQTDLMRYLSYDAETGTTYGAGFHTGDLLEFGERPLRLLRRTPLHGLGMGELVQARLLDGDMFVSGMDPPMFARLDAKTLEPRAVHSFRPLETRMPFNWGYFAPTPDHSRLFVNMYITDVDKSGAFLELDRSSLDVLRKVELPEPTLISVLDEPRHRLLLSAGDSDRLYEVDRDRFQIVGIHRGLPHARFLVYDSRHDWILVGSFISGEIAFLDGSTFQEVFRARLSRRISHGFIDESGENCYIVTSEGLYRLQLDEFAASIGRSRLPAEPGPADRAPGPGTGN